MAQNNSQAEMSEQYILNTVYEKTLRALVVLTAGYNGVNSQLPLADSLAKKITESGSYTYVGLAAPGTAQSSALWQAFRIDESTAGTTIITYADGNANFDNVASDLTALTYS